MNDFSLAWIQGRLGRAERRQVTVLFCDIVDPSARVAPLDPEETADALVGYRRKVAGIVERYGGYTARTFGDGVLVYWGYPKSEDDDARRAVAAALEIAAAFKGELDLRCALDTGIVVAGRIDDAEASTLDIVGNAPTTAARLHALALPNSVLVSERTRQMTPHAFRFRAFAPPRNLESPCLAWEVVERRTGWRRSSRAASAHIVGHEVELRAIDECWSTVQCGGSRALLITGEAGVGKSTLLGHLHRTVVASGGTWVEAGCLPEKRHSVLQPVREGMRDLLGGGAHAVDDRSAALRLASVELSGASSQDRRLLEAFFDLRPADAGAPGPAVAPVERLYQLLALAISQSTLRRPLAFAVEDIHWADQATVDFLSALGDRLSAIGGLCLASTARSGNVRPLQPAAGAMEIAMGRLSNHHIEALLRTGGHAEGLSEGVKRRIVERSEGIPFYAEELARLYADASENRLSPDLLHQPSSLNVTLAARLDGLGEFKALAQAAAVLGRDFDERLLAHVLGMDRLDLLDGLSLLVTHGVVMPNPHRHRESHRFAHILYREAAYKSLLKARRKELHHAAAETLSEHFPLMAEQQPEIVAGHFEGAGDHKGAFRWWRLAAERAVQVSASRAAVAHLERALAAKAASPSACSEQEEISVLRLLGPQLASTKGNGAPEVLAVYERMAIGARDLAAAEPGDFDALWGLVACHLVSGRITEAKAIGTRLEAAAVADGSDERLVLAHRMQGLAKLQAGELAGAIGHYAQVHARYDETRHPALRLRYASDQGALALAQAAWAQAIAGQRGASRASADQAMALAERINHPHTSAHVVCVLAVRAQTLGEREAAAALASAGKALGDRHEFPYWSAWADIILGWLACGRDPDRGAAAIEHAITAYRRTGARQALPYANLLLADVALGVQRPRAALAALDRAWSAIGSSGSRLYAAELLRMRAEAERALGAPRTLVSELLREAAVVAETQGAMTFWQRAAHAGLDGENPLRFRERHSI